MSKKPCKKNSPVLYDSFFMAHNPTQPATGRRRFLTRLLKGSLAVAAAAFVYPLLRFSGFKVKPQPRYIVIRKTILPGGFYTEHDFILFVSDQGPMAISRRCTHLGCRVHFRQELDLIECPCHQSRFTRTGLRTDGPAKENLAIFPVRVLRDDKGDVNGYEVTL